MKKIVSMALVAVLSLALAVPVSAAGRGGSFHGGFHHGRAFGGGVFVDPDLGDPYDVYPYATYPDPAYAPPPVYQPQASVARPVQPEICYPSGCYYMQGDGVTARYSWVWVPAAPMAPPAPPSR